MMTTEQNRLRSDVLNTLVVTRDTGKRLGVVKELLVDIDRREVVALGMRDNFLAVSGMPRYMLLDSISQIGDVILVDNEDVVEDIDIDAYSTLINCEVITESGEPLGRVRSFKFNTESGQVCSLILASLGIPQIPDRVLSTYELPIEEIVSSGPNRLIVFEGAEERLVQLTVGVLEGLGIGKPPWERDEEESYYTPKVRQDNLIGTGIPLKPAERPIQPPIALNQEWEEDEWQEEAPPVKYQQRELESIRYEEDEEDNWGDEVSDRPPISRYEEPVETTAYVESYGEAKIDGDAWDDEDDEPEPYIPPKINIPMPEKMPEPMPEKMPEPIPEAQKEPEYEE